MLQPGVARRGWPTEAIVVSTRRATCTDFKFSFCDSYSFDRSCNLKLNKSDVHLVERHCCTGGVEDQPSDLRRTTLLGWGRPPLSRRERLREPLHTLIPAESLAAISLLFASDGSPSLPSGRPTPRG